MAAEVRSEEYAVYVNFWISEWRDRGRGEEAIDTATSAEEAVETIRRFLENETACEEEDGEDRPALDLLFKGMDPITLVTDMDNRVDLECESGDFSVRRTMRFQDDESPRCLNQAARSLFDFAELFLVYHDNKTADNVTIRTLEHAARAAVAKAAGNPPAGPMTPEMIEKLKQHYLAWTGGCTPDDEDEIFTYIELAMESGPDPEEVRMVLKEWMEQINDEAMVTPRIVTADRKTNQ